MWVLFVRTGTNLYARTSLSHSSRLDNIGIGRGLCQRGLWNLVNPEPRFNMF